MVCSLQRSAERVCRICGLLSAECDDRTRQDLLCVGAVSENSHETGPCHALQTGFRVGMGYSLTPAIRYIYVPPQVVWFWNYFGLKNKTSAPYPSSWQHPIVFLAVIIHSYGVICTEAFQRITPSRPVRVISARFHYILSGTFTSKNWRWVT